LPHSQDKKKSKVNILNGHTKRSTVTIHIAYTSSFFHTTIQRKYLYCVIFLKKTDGLKIILMTFNR